MAPSLTVLTMVRNEADRLLPEMLREWGKFADQIAALDNFSDDNTRSILESAGCVVQTGPRTEDNASAWGRESTARQHLWDIGCNLDTDWLLILDADMIPLRDPRPLLHEKADAVSFRLYDLWSTDPLTFRHDKYWYAHHVLRVWAVRNPGPNFEAIWSQRGIHCGHLPAGLPLQKVVAAPEDHSLLHYAYAWPDWRESKAAAYKTQYHQMSGIEIAHADSILDPEPATLKLPYEPEYEIIR